MASHRQIEANRRNAARSTGPRTAGGKARSSANALLHGLSTPIIQSVELRMELENLAKCLVDDGLGASEALSAAEFYIERRRIRQARNDELARLRSPDDVDITQGDYVADALDRIARYDKRAASKRWRTTHKLMEK